MVVVLIIGILLAIAIPTFLGSKSQANHRAAQSNLITALVTEQSVYGTSQLYSGDTSATGTLATTELNLSWRPYSGTATEVTGTSVYVKTDQTSGLNGLNLTLSALSRDGVCYFIVDDNGTTGFAQITAPPSAGVCNAGTQGLQWYPNFNAAAAASGPIATPPVIPA